MSSSDVDFLVYDALYRVTGDPDFLEFRDAMMAADDAAYGGANNNTIQDAFYFRDVGTYSLFSYITGLAFVRVGDSPIWSVTISGGQSPYAVTWYKRDTPNDSWLGVGTGGTYQETISSRSSFQLRTCVTDGESITRCSAPFQVDVR